MTALETSGDTGAGVSTSVQDVSPVVVFSLVEQSLNTRLSETPSTGVQRFFLCPDNVLGVGVRVKVLLEHSPWEGVQLLDTCNGSVSELVLLAVLVQRCVNLTSAQNDTLDFLLWLDLELGVFLVCWIGNDPLEVRVTGEVLNARAG